MPHATTLDRPPAPASVPTTLPPAELTRRQLHRRAFEAAIWGLPVVNFELMFREFADKLGGDWNQILYWPRLLDWRNQTLTPNPDVIYLMPFFDTSEAGPMVLEIPPADGGLLNGSVMDCWQAAIEDIGPGGVDKGEGGKYLILPPGHAEADVPAGYIPMPCDTFKGYALIRSVLESGSEADVAKAVAFGRRVRLYPLSKADDPPPTAYVDASGVLFDSTIPYDLRLFRSLDRMVQAEPWLDRDRAMIDVLKTVGIRRGHPFDPDPAMAPVLDDAAGEVRAWLDLAYEQVTPYYGDGGWTFPVDPEFAEGIQSGFHTPGSYPVDARAVLYSFIFFSARHAGQAQYYLMTTRDGSGRALEGGAFYCAHVPADAPVSQYWSMTVYDRSTHAFIRNARWMGRSSQTPGLQRNLDGSVDVYFGPAAPAGQESNWIPTDPKGRFEVLARFYGPKPALFDKTWRLGELERRG